MNALLMHKNDIVAKMEIDEQFKLRRVFIGNKDLMPIGGRMNSMKLCEWWQDRAVPKTRKGCSNALNKLGYTSTGNMLVDNLALSLNDCYWIRPEKNNLSWEQVSLFSNKFVDIFGDYTFNSFIDNKQKTKFVSATSQGELQKKWVIDKNNNRILIKGNHGTQYQQSINEVFASLLHSKQLNIPYVTYKFVDIETEHNEKGIGCACKNFCSENIESFSAWEAIQIIKNRPSENYYMKLRRACEILGMNMEYFKYYIDYLIATDFLLSNTDRHMNNIALLRDSNTLEILGFSPIYDSGNSMFFRHKDMPITNLRDIKTHSFLDKEVNMLRLINNRNIIDLAKLPTKQEFYLLYSKDIEERHYRIEHLYNAFIAKCNMYADFQNGINIWENNRYKN